MKRFYQSLTVLLLLQLVFAPVVADVIMTAEEIWDACWSEGQHRMRHSTGFGNSISLVVHNISRSDWDICVYDNLCANTLYRGLLRHNHSVTLGGCVDTLGRGSISLMNAKGEIWFFENTGDRVITLEK
ncbi:MAG: hypothetical protein QNJ78_00035 [Gammaproteobacteria bacterium]|nr:hypothetical protein [Gammaproteobacteria bacterium]